MNDTFRTPDPDWFQTLAHELPEGVRLENMIMETVFPSFDEDIQNIGNGLERAYSDTELIAFGKKMDELPDGTIFERQNIVADNRVFTRPLMEFPRNGIFCTVPEPWFEPHTQERMKARYSFSGAQDKFTAVLEGKESGSYVLRVSDHKREIGNVIVKPYSFSYPFQPENEYFCMRVLELCGFNTAKTVLFRAKVSGGIERAHLCCERFDLDYDLERPFKKTVRQVAQLMDLPAVSGGKYSITTEELFNFLRERLNKQDMMEFAMGYVFGYILGNGDMHAKNFSVFIESDGTYTLTPFYDMLDTRPYNLSDRLCLPIGKEMTHSPDPVLLANLISDSLDAKGFEILVKRLSAVPKAIRIANREIESIVGDVGLERFRFARREFLKTIQKDFIKESKQFQGLILDYYISDFFEP